MRLRIEAAVRHTVRILIAEQADGEVVERARTESVIVIDADDLGGDRLIAGRIGRAERSRAINFVRIHVVERARKMAFGREVVIHLQTPDGFIPQRRPGGAEQVVGVQPGDGGLWNEAQDFFGDFASERDLVVRKWVAYRVGLAVNDDRPGGGGIINLALVNRPP